MEVSLTSCLFYTLTRLVFLALRKVIAFLALLSLKLLLLVSYHKIDVFF